MEEIKIRPFEETESSMTSLNAMVPGIGDSAGGQAELQETSKAPPKKKKKKGGFRKAPQAPRRFKSPYILFSISKMAKYKSCSPNVQVTEISRRIAQEWKLLPDTERKKWDQVALQDKLRYNAEKSLYTGPWQVPSKRSKKDPSAPKRPPSAFLFYCQTQRKKLKQENPDMKNTEISKLLGQQWKDSPPEIRQPHIDREQQERESYKSKIAEWRQQRQEEEASMRQQRQAVAEQYIRSGAYAHPSSEYQQPGMLPWGTMPAPTVGGSAHPPPPSQPASHHSRKVSPSSDEDLYLFPPPAKSPGHLAPPPSMAISTPLPRLGYSTAGISQQKETQANPEPTPITTSDQFTHSTEIPVGQVTSTGYIPPIPFAYSEGEIVETTAMSTNDRHLFPPFFHGGSDFDPALPLLEPNSPLY